MGKESVQEVLAREYSITLSASTVGRVIARNKFFFADTASHRQKRGESTWGDVSETVTGELPSDVVSHANPTKTGTASDEDTPPLIALPDSPMSLS
jgi:hypothetical protein